MDEPDDTPSPTPTRARGTSPVAAIKGLLLTFIILTALWFGLRYVLTPLIASKEPVQIGVKSLPDDIEPRLKALEEKIAALPEAAAPADLSPLEARIAALENAPKPEAAPAAVPQEFEAVKADIAALKNENRAELKSVILIGQLQEAIRSGRPFANELTLLVSLRPDLQETLTPITPSAPTGVATLAQLQEQFASAISPALAPEAADKSFAQNLRSLVKIRKVGGAQKGADDQAVIARAEAALAKGEIAEALRETQSLSPAGAKNFERWQASAKATLAAQAALMSLQSQLAGGAGR